LVFVFLNAHSRRRIYLIFCVELKVMTQNSRRHFSAALVATLLLTACGGSDSDLHSKDLYTAYEVVTEGMTLTQLKTVIGAEPAGSQADEENDITIHSWVADKGSYLETKLHVNVQEGYGVVGKTVVGPSGSKTASYL
jgi:hypothetical protein